MTMNCMFRFVIFLFGASASSRRRSQPKIGLTDSPTVLRKSARQSAAAGLPAIDPSPEAKACRAALERLLRTAADIGRAQAGGDFAVLR
jgi:hypothetical protein